MTTSKNITLFRLFIPRQLRSSSAKFHKIPISYTSSQKVPNTFTTVLRLQRKKIPSSRSFSNTEIQASNKNKISPIRFSST